MSVTHSFTHNSKVVATETINEITAGDTGVVWAAWRRKNICVKWDKDGKLRRINVKRLKHG